MADNTPPARYRSDRGIYDALRREVRELTDEITEARRELQRELPRRRRSDRKPDPTGRAPKH
jgi:hypothetical protein